MTLKTESLRNKIIVRIVPIATILVLASCYLTYRSVNRAVHDQISQRVISSALQATKETHRNLSLANDACRAVANNDLIVNGIVDLQHRHSTIQSFIRSLELPGAKIQNVAMTNYRGESIAVKFSNEPKLLQSKDLWLPIVMDGRDFTGIVNDMIIVAAPVIYSGRPEGAVAAAYDVEDFFEGLSTGTNHTVAALSLNGQYFYSTHPAGIPKDSREEHWLTASYDVDGIDGLKVTSFESSLIATKPASMVRSALIFCTVLTCLAVVGSISLASTMATQPVHSLTNAVCQVRETKDLSLRVLESGSSEFRQLAMHFNAMMKELESTTVSKEQFRKLALVARYTDNAVVITDAKGRIEWVNEGFERISGYQLSEVIGKIPGEILQGEQTDKNTIQLMHERLQKLEGFDVEVVNYTKSGDPYWAAIEVRPIYDEEDNVTRFIAIESDISQRKKAEEERARLGQELQSAAHHAGMAEIATGVLHNIGNVLNSINVSVRYLQESIQDSGARRVIKLIEAVQPHEENLHEYLVSDPKGQKVWPYLKLLGNSLSEENATVLSEFRELIANVDLVAQIIASQQSLAQSGGFREPVDLKELLDTMVKMQAHGISKYNIEVVTEYEDVPTLVLEKHKLIQVLVNLITNAKQSLRDSETAHKTMRVVLARRGESAHIRVSDNGVGISAENLNRIFSHGFTTKSDGHGFGLHSCALAIHEMGGEINVESEGEGQGACFSISIPLDSTLTDQVDQDGNHEVSEPGNDQTYAATATHL